MDNRIDTPDIKLIQLSNYVRPEIKEYQFKDYVLNGEHNSFFQYIIDRYQGSPTNEAIINVYKQLLFGKGIALQGQDVPYDALNEVFQKREQRKCINDYILFGMYAMQIVRARGGGVASIEHIAVNKLALEKYDENGVINNVYYSDDWTKPIKYKPKKLPVYNGALNKSLMIKLVIPYQAGQTYYANPDYLAGLQYAHIEEEISNFSLNHILNGLSFGYIINFNNGGAILPEQKDEIERRIKQKLTGSNNAGKFILSFNDGKEAEVTVAKLDVNDAHNQWESLREDAKYQILTAHGVTSPLLFGMPAASGFGSNADELNVASKLLQDYQISPKQDIFIDELQGLLELNGLETDLEFIPLRDTYGDETQEEAQPIAEPVVDETPQEEEAENLGLQEHSHDCDSVDFEALLSKGEMFNDDEWDIVDARISNEITLKESDLNTIFKFASLPKGNALNPSDQDTSLFKIRYAYAGNPNPERDFCRKLMATDRIWRADDLQNAGIVNAGFGIDGANTYDIFLYKGGPNCKHFWQRVVLLRKGNKRISVNEARRLILELEPEDRAEARWETNDPKVARIPFDMPNNGYFRPR